MLLRCGGVRFGLALCAFILTATLAPAAGAAPVSFNKATDLVVFGRVTTLSYEVLDEFGINSAIVARLTITRVVRGRPPSSVLTIKYITHSDLVADREFQFHLRRSKEGTWLVCNDGGGPGYICR